MRKGLLQDATWSLLIVLLRYWMRTLFWPLNHVQKVTKVIAEHKGTEALEINTLATPEEQWNAQVVLMHCIGHTHLRMVPLQHQSLNQHSSLVKGYQNITALSHHLLDQFSSHTHLAGPSPITFLHALWEERRQQGEWKLVVSSAQQVTPPEWKL